MATITPKSDNKYKEYARTPHFKLCSIAHLEHNEGDLFIRHRDSCEGLAIEKLCHNSYDKEEDKKSYYVICFIHYNQKDDEAELDSVANRILDLESSEFDEFKAITELGIKIVELENKYKNSEEE